MGNKAQEPAFIQNNSLPFLYVLAKGLRQGVIFSYLSFLLWILLMDLREKKLELIWFLNTSLRTFQVDCSNTFVFLAPLLLLWKGQYKTASKCSSLGGVSGILILEKQLNTTSAGIWNGLSHKLWFYSVQRFWRPTKTSLIWRITFSFYWFGFCLMSFLKSSLSNIFSLNLFFTQ